MPAEHVSGARRGKRRGAGLGKHRLLDAHAARGRALGQATTSSEPPSLQTIWRARVKLL